MSCDQIPGRPTSRIGPTVQLNSLSDNLKVTRHIRQIWRNLLRSGEIFQLFLNKHVYISTKVQKCLVSCKNFRDVWFIQLPFLSISPFSLSSMSRWVDLRRFVTDFNLFFSNGQFYYYLAHYRQFCPKWPLQHTENGRSLRFPPICKVNLGGWPLN